ncbi:hypothetical protein [Candidatus Phytoplasma melaleucae]|uniref:Effector n=1 Tax=Candidatus Phytoplasma melaleucae TaxID=2982630 RepID=A0ABT9DCW8_9MOLU|nr:hypothetical protein ['Melaleuca sp.' phytoplasma]MDO8167940.1 hypothetical protein ['Melaleuca sp.' phytoplasma]
MLSSIMLCFLSSAFIYAAIKLDLFTAIVSEDIPLAEVKKGQFLLVEDKREELKNTEYYSYYEDLNERNPNKKIKPKHLFPQNEYLGRDDAKHTYVLNMLHEIKLNPDDLKKIPDDVLDRYNRLSMNYKIVLLHQDNFNKPEHQIDDKKNLTLVDTRNGFHTQFQVGDNQEPIDFFPLSMVYNRLVPWKENNGSKTQLHAAEWLYGQKLDKNLWAKYYENDTKNYPLLCDRNPNNQNTPTTCKVFIQLQQSISLNKEVFNLLKNELQKLNKKIDDYDNYMQCVQTIVEYDLVDQNENTPESNKLKRDGGPQGPKIQGMRWTSKLREDAPQIKSVKLLNQNKMSEIQRESN